MSHNDIHVIQTKYQSSHTTCFEVDVNDAILEKDKKLKNVDCDTGHRTNTRTRVAQARTPDQDRTNIRPITLLHHYLHYSPVTMISKSLGQPHLCASLMSLILQDRQARSLMAFKLGSRCYRLDVKPTSQSGLISPIVAFHVECCSF